MIDDDDDDTHDRLRDNTYYYANVRYVTIEYWLVWLGWYGIRYGIIVLSMRDLITRLPIFKITDA